MDTISGLRRRYVPGTSGHAVGAGGEVGVEGGERWWRHCGRNKEKEFEQLKREHNILNGIYEGKGPYEKTSKTRNEYTVEEFLREGLVRWTSQEERGAKVGRIYIKKVSLP